MKTRQKYGLTTSVIVEFGRLVIEPKCNGFTIRNTGTTLVVFMQDVIDPGDSKAFGGNQDEEIQINEDIGFRVQAVPPATITNMALVTQKYFID